MIFDNNFNNVKKQKIQIRFTFLLFVLNVCFMTFSLIGTSLINSYYNPNELDYIANAITVNNKNNKKEMSFWQITPDPDYYGNWQHWQFDETMYSISELYTTRGFSEHNHTFMINYISNEEVFYYSFDSIHYVSVITSPSRVGFKSLGLSFLNNHTPDYKNEFYISETLFNNIANKSGSIDLSICSQIKSIEYSAIVKTISNDTVKNLAGDEFIIVPYKYAFNIKEYTGHTSFVLCLRHDYYENYAFSRVIKHAFYGIEKGSKYKAFFHDTAATLIDPFEQTHSVLQATYEKYVAHVPKLAIAGYIILFPSIAFVLFLNLFVLFKKRQTNIYFDVFSVFCSFTSYTIFSSIIQTVGTTWFFPWSFVSRIVVALVCALIFLLLLACHFIFGKKYCNYLASNGSFCEINI